MLCVPDAGVNERGLPVSASDEVGVVARPGHRRRVVRREKDRLVGHTVFVRTATGSYNERMVTIFGKDT
jgi:hypothetical protein